MISYEKFKSIFDKLNGEPEVTFVYSTGEKYFLTPFDSDNPAVLAKRVNKDNNVK